MKYKVGDKVRVRDDLICYERYKMHDSETYDRVNTEMQEFKGKTLTISRHHPDGKYNG